MAVESRTDLRIAETPTSPLPEFTVRDPYLAWLERERVPRIEGFAFEDLRALELSPWPRKGGSGAVINIPYHVLLNDAQVVEIEPGSSSEPEHHLYEETVYILSGNGTTSVWYGRGEKHTFEWSEGSLFSIPLNAWYQHFNLSGRAPVRYLAVTNAPPMMRLLADDDAIFNSSLEFPARLGEGESPYSGSGKLYQRRVWQTNFIPDASEMALYGWSERGGGGINVMLEMAGGDTKSHISEFPVGTYKKAHRHGPGAHLVILSGQGFSLLWTKEDLSDLVKADWKQHGMVVVPSDACFHQHFNSGTTRARYLALRPGSMGTTPPGGRSRMGADVSIKEGGWQVEYEDEDPRVHQIFEEELRRNGAPCLMRAFVEHCTGEVGPVDERLT